MMCLRGTQDIDLQPSARKKAAGLLGYSLRACVCSMLTPPQGFGCVEEGIYRTTSIDPDINLPFLQTLGLKTIICLNPARPDKPVRTFAQDNSINLIHLSSQPWRQLNDWMTLSREIIQDVLTYALDKRNYPLLILDATNAFVGVLRILQHWSYASVVNEYHGFVGDYKASYFTEVFFEKAEFQVITHEEAAKRRKSTEHERSNSIHALTTNSEVKDKQRSKTLTLHIPPPEVLPDWFIRQDELWRKEKEKEKGY